MFDTLALIAIFLMTVVFHEFAHGLVAYLNGDPTAKQAGRLTLNPLKHIDPFWTVFLPALMFFSTGGRFAIGMAKPVPVDFARLHHPKKDMVWVGLAGPLANFIFAGVLNIFFRLFEHPFLLYGIYFNLGLGIFNMVPIPPLDGSRVLAGLLPAPYAVRLLRLEPYGFLIVLGLYFTGVLSRIILPLMDFFCAAMGLPQIGVHF